MTFVSARARGSWILVMGALVTLAISGCGNSPPPKANASGPATGGSSGATIVPVTGAIPATIVKESDRLTFVPATVTIAVGKVVEWQNAGTTPHNVTFDNGPHSATMNGGDVYELKFTKPGTFHYVCTFHGPAMAGTVTVIETAT